MYFLVRNEAILGMQELEVLDSDIKMIKRLGCNNKRRRFSHE